MAVSYKSLWQVERAYRELKSGVDLRPLYHWTEKRIRGHVIICFLALVLEMALRRKIKELDKDIHYDDLLMHLTQLPGFPGPRDETAGTCAGAAVGLNGTFSEKPDARLEWET